ncbi:MAG: glutathione S-transferase family protein [Bdellovibrionia bacterium]
MFQIYGSPLASPGRVYWTAEEVGIPWERVPLNMREKQHKSPEFLKLNPNGKVPVVVDGELVLWESSAITFYLAEKHKPELLGKGLTERALVYQWSIWAMTELQPPHVDLFIQKIFVPEERRDLGLIERSLKAIPPRLEILDTHLKGREWIVGNGFTLADINVASVVEINKGTENDISQFEAIGAWLKRINDRPAHKKLMSLPR